MAPQYFLFRFSGLLCLLSLLTACSGNSGLQSLFTPDAKLPGNTPSLNSPSNPTQATLPDNFPRDIPRYPEATLVASEAGANSGQWITRWTSTDPSNLIAIFYQQTFESNNWEILQPFTPDGDPKANSLVARRDGLEVKVSFVPSAANTEFAIAYQQDNPLVQPGAAPATPSTASPASPLTFSDLAQVPDPVRRYISDLASLGVLTSSQGQGNQFQPNAPITRRDYARWLVAANNALYANSPGKQIRPGSTTAQPAFQDINTNDPDFGVIQGLAEAGLIPSRLTGDNSALLFRPNAPLTRENLILWKVPLDNRKALPAASIDSIKQTWGFQDATKIDPKASQALYADFQNGEQANIRRVFGYTTLFQPKKLVTRAEAAATLWYFGFQGDGISAQEALQSQGQQNPSP
jgi:hypothetical protein